MAISPAVRALNASAHTLGDVQSLARAEPQKALEYLCKVEARLRGAGKTTEADAVKALLSGTGDLVERMARACDALGSVFPNDAIDWGKVQSQGAASVGWSTDAKVHTQVQFITGTVHKGDDGVTQVTTDGGRVLTLRQSVLAGIPQQMSNAMLEGFLDEGRLSLSGTLGEDGKTFNVEAYALNTDGKFDTFCFGRVNLTGDEVQIQSPRGVVDVTDPELKAVLKSFPRLAVIIPGAAEDKDGKLTHSGKADTLIALARFKEPPPAAATGELVAMKANMADNHFVEKPLRFPAAQLDRANHSSRLWVRGWPTMEATGPTAFNANYISKKLDSYAYSTGAEVQAADPVQAAVMTEIQ